ncbi:TNF receptor-associated factor 2-like protein, partial [Lates japonicus]
MEGLQPQGLELAGHKLVELQQSLRELEARVSQLSTTSSGPPVQGAAASSSSSSSGPPGPPASAPLPPPPTLAPTLSVSTSFTPLPSSVGAALELQLHSEKTKVAELGQGVKEVDTDRVGARVGGGGRGAEAGGPGGPELEDEEEAAAPCTGGPEEVVLSCETLASSSLRDCWSSTSLCPASSSPWGCRPSMLTFMPIIKEGNKHK